MPTKDQLIDSREMSLPDGRRVTMRAYDDGSVRLRVRGGAPYVMTQAFLAGGKSGHAVVHLEQAAGRPVPDEDDE